MNLRRKPLVYRLEMQSMPVTECGCWIWLGRVSKFGHGSTKYLGRAIGAHRAAWIAYRGEIPDGLWVLHSCDVPGCINPDHLFLGTHDDNMADMARKGRSPRGENNSYSKLTEDDVALIRAADGTQLSIASRFGVHQSQVSRIKHGKQWRAA